ncbi:MAG TPA: hypothetical protein VG838_01215 [Opitutaceae bacterium]|nr:hypothetical protein [Opitutaceae bacterium]
MNPAPVWLRELRGFVRDLPMPSHPELLINQGVTLIARIGETSAAV